MPGKLLSYYTTLRFWDPQLAGQLWPWRSRWAPASPALFTLVGPTFLLGDEDAALWKLVSVYALTVDNQQQVMLYWSSQSWVWGRRNIPKDLIWFLHWTIISLAKLAAGLAGASPWHCWQGRKTEMSIFTNPCSNPILAVWTAPGKPWERSVPAVHMADREGSPGEIKTTGNGRNIAAQKGWW